MKDTKMLYQIDTGYACFGIVAEGKIVVEAADIAKWAVGKSLDKVLSYYVLKKNAKVRFDKPSL